MAPVFGTIDMLKPGRSTFGLELRLIRCYENSSSGGIECIFHDRQGDRIHVTIPGSNSEKYKQQLNEDSVYALIDYVIGLNIMKYRTTSCIHKIIVFKHTRLFEVFHEEFPKQLLQPKSFPEISQMDNIADTAMFDVIGAIVSHYKPQYKEINGKMTRLMDIMLEDIEVNTITCTVWEQYVEQVMKFLESGPEAPVAIILQLCRPNIFRSEMKVSTLFNITKIHTDQKLEDIREFIIGYLTTGKVRSSTICTLTSTSTRSLNDEIEDGDLKLKTISEVIREGREGNFWIYATILCVDGGDWAYLACKRCQKKLKRSGTEFFCEKCQSFDIAGRLRYKLTLRVVDESGTTTFLLWDKETTALLGKSALELSEGGSIDEIPEEIEKLTNRKVLFNISVQPAQTSNYTGTFSVARICCDRVIIQKVCGKRICEEEDSFSKTGGQNAEEMVGSTEEAISGITSIDGNGEDIVIQKTIQQVIEEKKVGEMWIHGNVKSIDSINRYSFLACKQCLKELEPQEELKFFCEKCHSFDICGKSRYKLDVQVADGTGEAMLDMWEIQGLELIGKKPTDDQPLDILPTQIDEIVGAQGFFKIIVVYEKMKGPFTVLKVTTDDTMRTLIDESIRRSKGKKKIEGDADEAVYICNALETPPPTKSVTDRKTSAGQMIEDDTNRKLIDEFSTNALKKRQKRNIKRE